MTSAAPPHPVDAVPADDSLLLLSPARRALAGLVGGLFVVGFLTEAVCHPAAGWLAALLWGVPMVWLIQTARTGELRHGGSLLWFAVWYAIFASGWLIAVAIEAPAERLGPEASLAVFLGSIVFVGGASSLARLQAESQSPDC